MKTNLFWTTFATACLSCFVAHAGDDAPPAAVETSDVAAQLERAKDRLAPAYLLAYKFAAGDEIRTKVVHLVTVETKIRGTEQTASTRSVSTKLWRIKRIEESGNIVFEHSVEHVDMWEKTTGRAEVRYDSAKDTMPPQNYGQIAASIGKVLSVVTMDQHGRIVAREDKQPSFNPGIGDLTIPFPAQPVKAGATWSIPDEIKVRLEDGTLKKIATRQQYQLEKVEAGLATISVTTQVLTPVSDPKVQSQLIQRMQKGTIKFDVDAGRLVHKQMDLDESVFAFSGPDSHMQYLARFTEEPLSAEATAARAGTEKR